VEERRLGSRGGEVAGIGHDEVPVGHVAEGGGGVGQRIGPGQHPGSEEMEQSQDGHQDEQRGQEPAGPAGPEMAQVHRAGAAPLDHQKRRDQVAGKNEEGIDAVETAGEPGEPVVIRHDREHGQRPEAVEPEHMREFGDPSGRLDLGLELHQSMLAHPFPLPAGTPDVCVSDIRTLRNGRRRRYRR
jgi:hypothetical protein